MACMQAIVLHLYMQTACAKHAVQTQNLYLSMLDLQCGTSGISESADPGGRCLCLTAVLPVTHGNPEYTVDVRSLKFCCLALI